MASKKVEKHIENALEKIRIIFNKAAERIDAQKPGEKLRATYLAEELGKEYGISGATLYPTLQFLFEGFPNTKRQRGAHGGIVKLEETKVEDDVDNVTDVT